MRSRGLTLSELVVVIAVITLLTALSMPVWQRSRERARAVVCAGRIRHLVAGLQDYETENGLFPHGFQALSGELGSPRRCAGIPGTVDPVGRWWFDCSERVDHATGDGVERLTCPSKRQEHSVLSMDLLCGNYGANLFICRPQWYVPPYGEVFAGDPLSSSQVRRPTETLLLVDSGYSLISWWHATREPPVPLPPAFLMLGGLQHTAYVPGMEINMDRILLPGQMADAKGGRHPNKTVNVGFVDGSVAPMKADSLLVGQSGASWDSSPLWEPGGDAVSSQATAVP